jgi:SAM-dependent methyltransferase
MSNTHRETARRLAAERIASGDPMGWFEALYAQARGSASVIPWADLAPNPNLVDYLDSARDCGRGTRALKVGCGLGDDAEELASRGFDTTAFDVSPTAIAWCRRRFPTSTVTYLVADLFNAPGEWQGAFSLVVESYTLQVLPPRLRRDAIRQIAGFTAPGGTLLAIARGREPTDAAGDMPWPLTKDELDAFHEFGLAEQTFEDFLDTEEPPVRRFRAVYRRASSPPSLTIATV